MKPFLGRASSHSVSTGSRVSLVTEIFYVTVQFVLAALEGEHIVQLEITSLIDRVAVGQLGQFQFVAFRVKELKDLPYLRGAEIAAGEGVLGYGSLGAAEPGAFDLLVQGIEVVIAHGPVVVVVLTVTAPVVIAAPIVVAVVQYPFVYKGFTETVHHNVHVVRRPDINGRRVQEFLALVVAVVVPAIVVPVVRFTVHFDGVVPRTDVVDNDGVVVRLVRASVNINYGVPLDGYGDGEPAFVCCKGGA